MFIKNATQMPIIGCYRCGHAVFMACRLPGANQFDRHAGRKRANRVEYMLAAGDRCGELFLGRVGTPRCTLPGALLDPAGSMCCRYAG